jgi:hypothetical protein
VANENKTPKAPKPQPATDFGRGQGTKKKRGSEDKVHEIKSQVRDVNQALKGEVK